MYSIRVKAGGMQSIAIGIGTNLTSVLLQWHLMHSQHCARDSAIINSESFRAESQNIPSRTKKSPKSRHRSSTVCYFLVPTAPSVVLRWNGTPRLFFFSFFLFSSHLFTSFFSSSKSRKSTFVQLAVRSGSCTAAGLDVMSWAPKCRYL